MVFGPSDTEQLVLALDAELKTTPYRAIGVVGHGGMGAVFEVEHRVLKRRFVIKILRESNRPDLEDRLRLEAQALAQLSHPNLLQVVDLTHTASGRPFIVSERLRGSTLKEAIGATGTLPVPDAIRYVCQALSGLAAAHAVGIVHRDIKLDNLFLCSATEHLPAHVKVIDFGIAKLVASLTPVDVSPLENPTAEGLMVGTPSFMSPEQVTSQPVDHRADLYGMGVVLYRLVTGRNPFICDDVIGYAAAHASEPPPPPSRFVELPEGLEAVILRCLEKSPDARYASASALIEALQRVANGPSRPSPTPRIAELQRRAYPNERAPQRFVARATERLQIEPARPSPAPAPTFGPRPRTILLTNKKQLATEVLPDVSSLPNKPSAEPTLLSKAATPTTATAKMAPLPEVGSMGAAPAPRALSTRPRVVAGAAALIAFFVAVALAWLCLWALGVLN